MPFQAEKILLLLSYLPRIWAQHCNYATLFAGRCLLLIYGIVPSTRCALLLLGGVLDASQSTCLATMTGVPRDVYVLHLLLSLPSGS